MKTYVAKPADIKREWYVVDASGQTLGRMATKIATYLRGKHKPTYTPYTDTGDFVVVINADKIVLTGKKMDQKMYRYHSGYIGGLKEKNYRRLMATHPERAIEHAVKGMLPKNSLGRQMYRKLKVYAGPKHEHAAQKPIELIIEA